jgi:hypothetical protein
LNPVEPDLKVAPGPVMSRERSVKNCQAILKV